MGEENWLRILLRSTHRVTRRVGSLSHSISSFFSPSLFSVVSVLLCANSTVTTNQLSDLKTCTQKIDFQRQFNLMLFSLVAFPAVWCFPSENIDCAIARCFGLLPSMAELFWKCDFDISGCFGWSHRQWPSFGWQSIMYPTGSRKRNENSVWMFNSPKCWHVSISNTLTDHHPIPKEMVHPPKPWSMLTNGECWRCQWKPLLMLHI